MDSQPNAGEQVEPEYERLVKVVQNREGNHTKQEREDALIDLAHRFRYLIKKIATKCWRKSTGESREDFEHDVMTTFCEMVLVDYIPKAYGGLAHFGPYVQNKLYWRTVYRAQTLVRESMRTFTTDFADSHTHDAAKGGAHGSTGSRLSPEIRDAILGMSTNVEDDVIGRMRDEEIQEQLNEVAAIAAQVLDEREKFVWDAYLYSPMMVKEIGGKLTPPIGTSRVNQIVIQARKKVLEELGRRKVLQSLK